ncbi:Serpentine Receptor, class T [Caenorhabditis elegans]|uniref:Serpentine Receptor, class T n=1 Tax=Caenorhabditis elegans TaxID=6239 RepID=J7SEY9_CAEEL|nr:Serpentine Receptor, class T [Caenorhabditis elegans]CCM09399.1 Serpentine Receptor, class T [Caenorhabditis elegans]|eukprot:NP_001263846.1 Serpentine Receptor, class U [Caenorhabditis elegans]
MSVYGHIPIDNKTEYSNFTYSFNVWTVFAAVTCTYTLFSFWITLKMCIFYLNNKNNEEVKRGLRLDVFRLFLLMQVWKEFHVLMDFLIVRIPLTSLFTSYCYQSKPVLLLKILSLMFTGVVYTSHSLTLAFCIQRVALLYAHEYHKDKIAKIFDIVNPLIIFVGHGFGIPFFFASSSCYQMDEPFPFGAIVITALRRDMKTYTIIYSIFSNTNITLTIILTIMMFVKLYHKRKITSELRRPVDLKSEKVLTATMILILLPVVVPSILSIANLFSSNLYAYMFLLRCIALDVRAHIVSCYFYYTHYIFKKKNRSTKIRNDSTIRTVSTYF